MHISRCGLILVLLALSVSAANASGDCKVKIFAELPVTMERMQPIVVVKINGIDARFVADSGAFYSVISPAAATGFKLPEHPASSGFFITGVGGTSRPYIATVKSFTLAKYVIPNVEFLVGGSEAGFDVVGVLGQNLWTADVDYDLANGMLRFIKPENCKQEPLAYWLAPSQSLGIVDLRKRTNLNPQPVGVAFVNGVEVSVAFDTGATSSMLSLSAAKRAGLTPGSEGIEAAGVIHGIGRRTVNSWVAPLANFKVGDEEIRHTHILIGDQEFSDFDMVLGADFFLSHHVYVANSQRKLYFTYNGGPVFDLNAPRRAQVAPPSAISIDAAGSSSTPTNKDSDNPHPDAMAVSAGNANLTNQPTDAAGFMRRGSAFAARRDFEHALSDLKRACELTPNDPVCHFELGRVQWQSGKGDWALQAFNRAIELRPDYVMALLFRARLNQAQHPIAKVDLETVDRLLAPEDNLRLPLGDMYNKVGEYDVAIHQYDLWINAHPHDAMLTNALNSRCWSQAEANRNLDRALADCNAALSAQPKRADILDSRGFVRLRRGELDKSIADYDAALGVVPNSASSLYGRGLAKLLKGLQAEGKADLVAASAIQPGIAEVFAGFGLRPPDHFD